MLEVDDQRISQQELQNIQRELQIPMSVNNGGDDAASADRSSMSPESSFVSTQDVLALKKRYRYKHEVNTLNEFMVKNFCVGLLIKYGALFQHVDRSSSGVSLKQLSNETNNMTQIQSHTIGQAELSSFVRVLLGRVKATKQQFKQMCIMCIKFMSICDKASKNYMDYLKYDARKVIIASLLLTFPTARRESKITLFSKATGLSKEQIRYCLDIVGPILKSELLMQKRTLFRHNHINDTNDHNNSNNEYSYDTSVDSRNSLNNARSQPSRGHASGVDIRSTDYGTVTNYYGSGDDMEDSYLLPIELEQFNEMGKALVHRNFLVK